MDTEETGALLIKKGQLRKRVTIIPLNQVTARRLTPNVIAAAEKIVGKENVTHAIQLIGFDKDVEAAMNYVFGTTLICSGTSPPPPSPCLLVPVIFPFTRSRCCPR